MIYKFNSIIKRKESFIMNNSLINDMMMDYKLELISELFVRYS